MKLNGPIGGVPVENVRAHDADEMAQALKKIPTAEREKIYYMIKGIELMGEQRPPASEYVG